MIFTEKPIFTEFNQFYYSKIGILILYRHKSLNFLFYARKFTNFTAVKMGKSVKIRNNLVLNVFLTWKSIL
jgi:hypothetical protein